MWVTEWRAISARIAAIIEASTFATQTRQYEISGVSAILDQAVRDIEARLKSLYEVHENELPDDPKICLWHHLENCDKQPVTPVIAVLAVTRLAMFKAEFEYLITDAEVAVRSLTWRAFTHLQSSIAAAEDVRLRWQQAFKNGETCCERLGASHLLQHGIWSFKADAAGARTDLVLGVQHDDWEGAQRATEGLVLTEWKLVRNPRQLGAKAEQARAQARRYTAAPLAGFELTSRRYIVVVSEERLDMPKQLQEDNVTYEHVNVAVAPKSPSADARSSTGHRS